ncbi:MAG: universal stress protein [Candidatus Thermoplasmatota archaeon]|nr:universal stress protein [Candidatus Thermoplasmatota archaeon]
MFKRILIATDNSALMPSLAEYTATLFPKAEYHIISVVETTAGLGQMSGGLREQLEKMSWDAAEKLDGILDKHGIKAKIVVVNGDPSKEIAEYASRMNFGLLAIGRHASDAMPKIKLGRVCSKTLERISCSALVIGNPVDAKAPKHILNPTTDSKYSRAASRIAIQLASKFNSKLDTIYVGTSAEARGTQALSFVKSAADSAGVKYNGIMGGEAPDIDIIERQKNYDMIIGSRGRTGAAYKFRFFRRRLALGKLERITIAASKIPILLIGEKSPNK